MNRQSSRLSFFRQKTAHPKVIHDQFGLPHPVSEIKKVLFKLQQQRTLLAQKPASERNRKLLIGLDEAIALRENMLKEASEYRG